MKRELRNRVLAAILAGTMGIPLASCSEDKIREEYETEKESVLDEIDSRLDEKVDEIVRRITEENKKINNEQPTVTTTYITESLTTETTTKEVPVETYTTTEEKVENTTTEVKEKQETIFNEPKTIEGMTKTFEVKNHYSISSKYKVTDGVLSNGQTGSYLYSLVKKLYGTYTDELASSILDCNPDSNGFFSINKEINLPSAAVYFTTDKDTTLQSISYETGVSINEITRLNNIEDKESEIEAGTKLLIKVLKENQKTYLTTTGEKANVYANTVIIGFDLIESEKTYTSGYEKSAFIKSENNQNQNTYYFVEFKENGDYRLTLVGNNINSVQNINGVPMIKIRNLSEEIAYKVCDTENKDDDKYKTSLSNTPFGTNTYYAFGTDLYCTFDSTDMTLFGFEPVSFEQEKQKVLK